MGGVNWQVRQVLQSPRSTCSIQKKKILTLKAQSGTLRFTHVIQEAGLGLL